MCHLAFTETILLTGGTTHRFFADEAYVGSKWNEVLRKAQVARQHLAQHPCSDTDTCAAILLDSAVPYPESRHAATTGAVAATHLGHEDPV